MTPARSQTNGAAAPAEMLALVATFDEAAIEGEAVEVPAFASSSSRCLRSNARGST